MRHGCARFPQLADFVEKLFGASTRLHRVECHFATKLIVNPDSKNPRDAKTLFYRRRLPRETPD